MISPGKTIAGITETSLKTVLTILLQDTAYQDDRHLHSPWEQCPSRSSSAMHHLKFFYLFIFILGVLGLCCLVRASSAHGATLSGGTGALDSRASAVATHGLNSCNFWAPEHRLSSCGMCLVAPRYGGIFQEQGSNPCPMHWQADSYPLRHQEGPTSA